MGLRKGNLIFALLVALCLTDLAAAKGLHYAYKSAGSVPGANYTVPFGISATHIVGYYSAPGVLDSYIQTGKTFLTVVPFGSITSYLFAINRNGLAVGGYCALGCAAYAGQHGYTYDYATGATASIDFPGASSTTAFGINDLGQIVGGYCSTNTVCPAGFLGDTDHAFLDDSGVFTTLDFPGAQQTQALGINNAGEITGTYFDATGLHSFVYEHGVYTTIDFPSASYTSASAINNYGVVAGLFLDGAAALHGFLYFNGKFTQIDVPGALGTGVSGINDSNTLVGLIYPVLGTQPFKAILVH